MHAAPDHIAAAAEALRRGEVVAFPTETVYGLGADARDADAIAKIFALKGRPSDHPLIVHFADAAELPRYARVVPPAAWQLAEAFWPGPLTLILPRTGAVHPAATGGHDTVGLRVPRHPVAQALLASFGGPVAAPSANRFGRISPTRADHVRAEFGDAAPLILEGGDCEVGLESTIVDLSDDTPAILRPGHIAPGEIARVLGVAVPVLARAGATPAPGTLESHYAPQRPLYLVDSATLRAVGLPIFFARRRAIVQFPPWAQGARKIVEMPADPVAYGRMLYAALREADEPWVDCILLELPPDTPAWLAVHDRLRRAATPLPEGAMPRAE